MSLLTTLAKDILTAEPDAKPFTKTASLWSMVFGATAFTIHNVSLWFDLTQSTETTLFWAVIGMIWIVCQSIATLRRHDVAVPNWIAVLAEAVLEGAPKP